MKRETRKYNKGLNRFAIATTLMGIILIAAGATVTSTGSGDSVPDWPLSYGSLAPPMIGGILYEHSHRLIAGFTAIMIIVLFFWIWKRERRKKVRLLALGVSIAVVLQAMLGGLRVLVVSTQTLQDVVIGITNDARIDTVRILIAAIHAILAQSIICVLAAVSVLTSKSWTKSKYIDDLNGTNLFTFQMSLVLLTLVFVQLIIGTLVRHTGAGTVIPDFPLSFGKIVPPFGNLPQNAQAAFPITSNEFTFRVAIQFIHRVFAFIILGFVFYNYLYFCKTGQFKTFRKLLLSLVCLQIVIGGLNIWTKNSILVTVPHVVIGALIFAGCVIPVLWSWRLKSESAKSEDSENTAGIFRKTSPITDSV
jgi:cytochrome c oxidase assembly protein subunit 15